MRFRSIVLCVCLTALAACGRLIPDISPPGGPRPYYPAPSRGSPAPGSGVYVARGAGVIDQRIDSGTPGRVQRATQTLAQCEAELAAARVTFSPTPDRVNSPTCGLTAARELLGSDVVQIDHMGVYACRPVNSVAGNRPSAHSRAAALDFSGVRLRDGRRITVAADWNDGGPEAAFLRRIRDDACKVFGTTLSPDYNALHHDHLHLEAESGRLCR